MSGLQKRGCRLESPNLVKKPAVERSGDLTAVLEDSEEFLLGDVVPRTADNEARAKALKLLEETCRDLITRIRAAAPSPEKRLLTRREAIQHVNLLKRQLVNLRQLDEDLGGALTICEELERVSYRKSILQIPDVEEV